MYEELQRYIKCVHASMMGLLEHTGLLLCVGGPLQRPPISPMMKVRQREEVFVANLLGS